MCNYAFFRALRNMQIILDKKMNRFKSYFRTLKFVVETFEHSTYESTNQSSLKSPKLLNEPIRKRFYKILDTSVINSPLPPLSLL